MKLVKVNSIKKDKTLAKLNVNGNFLESIDSGYKIEFSSIDIKKLEKLIENLKS